MWEQIEDRYVIPIGKDIPRPMKDCDACGEDTWRTDDDECGLCGAPLFDCPNCGEEISGKVDNCPECDAEYRWPDNTESE